MRLSPALIRDGLVVGAGDLVVIAGPCLVEDEALMVGLAGQLAGTCARHGAQFIFKASFDKANRSSSRSPRGPGIDRGLAALGAVGDELGVALTTDIHEPWQADRAAEIVDLIQIPAFLCRQTDLLTAAAATGKAVNVKKAQFLSPGDMRNVVDKLRAAGSRQILLTERGTTFGYGNLVVDFRSLPLLRDLGHPVVFDASHSVQLPGGRGDASGGESEFVPPLARAAAAVGIDALFMEVHPLPASAPSDGFNMVTPAVFDVVLREVQAIRRALERDVTMVADA